MTIRAKLYTAIVLTILGPLATTAVALHGMGRRWATASMTSMPRAERRGARARAQIRRDRHERLADGLRLRRRALAAAIRPLGGRATAEPRAGGTTPSREPRERALLGQLQSGVRPLHGPRCGGLARAPGGRRPADEGRSSSGPSCVRFEAMAAAAERAGLVRGASSLRHASRAFNDARDDGPPPDDRRGAGCGTGDHPAAVHGERCRTYGARGGAPDAPTTAREPEGGEGPS